MAKVFYVQEIAPDYGQINLFKTEKEALAYGLSRFEEFDMYGNPDDIYDEDEDTYYVGDAVTYKEGFLFWSDEDGSYVEAMGNEEARETAEGLEEYGAAAYFSKFKKGAYAYLGDRGADGTGFDWDWDGYEINESKNINKTMKHVPTFESFLNESTESKLNEKVNASAYIKAGTLGYNDQFLGRQSLSKTLSLDLGLSPKNEFTGPWIGFDHISMYASGDKGGTILDDALSGKYTYDELKAAAAEHMGI